MSSAELRKVGIRWDHIQLDAVSKVSDCLNTPLEAVTGLGFCMEVEVRQ